MADGVDQGAAINDLNNNNRGRRCAQGAAPCRCRVVRWRQGVWVDRRWTRQPNLRGFLALRRHDRPSSYPPRQAHSNPSPTSTPITFSFHPAAAALTLLTNTWSLTQYTISHSQPGHDNPIQVYQPAAGHAQRLKVRRSVFFFAFSEYGAAWYWCAVEADSLARSGMRHVATSLRSWRGVATSSPRLGAGLPSRPSPDHHTCQCRIDDQIIR